ncbi:pyruvate formate lyase activating enzyme [Sulfurivirga caldicuralii]|uniref:Pyruvate formate lyase activating enzyme n=1 Tax=Sulfurivirga caldicuralii TaxID=364032 RepID=A0A1N6DBY1_9GAMM|nr:AmmeMemoRadiSam system radical SAM enzyme [Sulfurivirga caldicuralii]SIN68299.1 pyruvate formate lyase activating enzyme [Sulfurivirga caldicuralii]
MTKERIDTNDPHVIPVGYWHWEGDLIQCDLCPRECKLHEGQRGFCFIRMRQDDQLWLTSYGRSSGFVIDPIEKKPLNHFLPGTPVLSFGTAGCNLACKYCQNWDMSKARDMDRLMDEAMPQDLADAALRTGCRAVAYTYNDPVIFFEYAIDTARACREKGIKNVAVTAGYINPEPRQEFFKHMDAANIDLKGFSEDFYRKLTGGHLQPVLDTIEYAVKETDCWVELTTLLIPGHNDSPEELEKMSQWIIDHCGPDTPLHFTAFHPDFRMLDVPPTPPHKLEEARKIAMEHGLNYVYTGNVLDPAGQTTYCPQCKQPVIGRVGYDITLWQLKDGCCCAHCGAEIAGVFEEQPGDWGSRRLPIRLHA